MRDKRNAGTGMATAVMDEAAPGLRRTSQSGSTAQGAQPVNKLVKKLTVHSQLKRHVSFSDLTQIGETYEKYSDYFSEYDRTPRYRRGKRLTEGDRKAILAEVEDLRNELFPDGRRYGDRPTNDFAAAVHGVTFIKKLKYNYHKTTGKKSPGASHDDDIAAEIAKLEQDMAAGQEAGGGLARSQTQSAEDLPSLASALDSHGEDEEAPRPPTPTQGDRDRMGNSFRRSSILLGEQMASLGYTDSSNQPA